MIGRAIQWALDKTFNVLEDALVFDIEDIAPFEEYTNAEQLDKSTNKVDRNGGAWADILTTEPAK